MLMLKEMFYRLKTTHINAINSINFFKEKYKMCQIKISRLKSLSHIIALCLVSNIILAQNSNEIKLHIFNYLKNNKAELVSSGIDIIQNVEQIDNQNSKLWMSFRYLKKDKYGEFDYDILKFEIFQFKNNILKRMVSENRDMASSYANIKKFVVNKKNYLIYYETPPGGSMGNTPIYNLIFYSVEDMLINNLPIPEKFRSFEWGKINFNSNFIIIDDKIENSKIKFEITVDNNLKITER